MAVSEDANLPWMLRNCMLGSSPSAVSVVSVLRLCSVEASLCLVSAQDLSALVRRVRPSAALLALSWPRGSIHIHDASYRPLLLSALAVALHGLLPVLASQQVCSYSSVCEGLSVAVAEQS